MSVAAGLKGIDRGRRALLGGGVLTGSALAVGCAQSPHGSILEAVGFPRSARARLAGPFRRAVACGPGCTTVDVHCHAFNGQDLPIRGFLTQTVPLPERWTRQVAATLHEQINRRARSGAVELAGLDAAFGAGAPLRLRPGSSQAYDRVMVLLGAAASRAEGGLGGGDVAATVQRFGSLLDFITHDRHEIAAQLVETYPTVELFTPALVDYDHFSEDQPATPLAAQLAVQERIARLSVRDRIGRPGARVHPMAAFNPLREVRRRMEGPGDWRQRYTPFAPDRPFGPTGRYACDAPPLPAPPASAAWEDQHVDPPADASALELVRWAIERGGFVGVKVYPPVGFLPTGNAGLGIHSESELGEKLDLALRAFYAYCEAEEVPVLTHAANSNGYGLGYGRLAGPAGWEPVLREFPRLRLDLGHFGHLQGVDEARGARACEAWMRQAGVLMERYPNVYADLANSLLPVERGFADSYLGPLAALAERFPRVRKRLMYGSDYWLNRLNAGHEQHVDAFSEELERRFGAETRADVMGGNALRFLGLLDDRGAKPLTRSRQRLIAFYGTNAKPGWLA